MKRRKKVVTKPFDLNALPPRQNLLIMPFLWLICLIATRRGRLKIHKVNMEGLKPPYLVLGTHHSFTDFFVTPLALFPHRANYVSELEGFEAFGEWKYRQVGCLGTRKFITDLALVENIKRVMERKGILVLYPEARYANVGTNSLLPKSVGKLCKHLGVPVVTLQMKGNYLLSPIWNLRKRKGVRLDAVLTRLFTAEEVARLSAKEIQHAIQQALTYDEYQWQEAAGIRIKEAWRAEGLQHPLYQCRDCKKEYHMTANGSSLLCTACGSAYTLTENGLLQSADGGTDLRIPDWYEWERRQVQEEIRSGRYVLDAPVHIESLPNAVNFIDLGDGLLHQDETGFSLTLTDYGDSSPSTLFFSAASCFSIHTEYDYRGKGQCVTLSTLNNTYFLFPKQTDFNVTKLQFATEYFWEMSRKGLITKEGVDKFIKYRRL